MKTALCTIAFRERSLEVVLDLAAGAGFDGVEVWGKPNHMPTGYNMEYTQRTAQEVRSRGLSVAQYGSYANPLSTHFEREMEDALNIATSLETDKIRVWAGTCGSADASDGEWEAAAVGFRTFSDRAAGSEITLVLEMHRGYLSDTVEGNLRLLGAVDRPNFRLNFQPIYTDFPEQVLESACKVAPYVTTVHAQNYQRVGSNARSLVSEGYVDYPAVITELKKAGFDGYLEVEFVREDHPEEALKADAAFLRSLCAG
ncbi:MAG: sugar phosphate isomerase/epimerase [bacterium]|nr:sugar phosphate isomerase/epimerase [bacterium]